MKIKPLLQVSFPLRREWVESLKGKVTVKKIFEEFPGFKNYEQVTYILLSWYYSTGTQ